jgi:tetratricopeptide (TPR) repeat protein
VPDERLQEASILIGLLEYGQADELLRVILRDAGEAGDEETASLACEALGVVATRRGHEAQAKEMLWQALQHGDMPHPAEREQLYWELARVLSGLGEADESVRLLEGAVERLQAPDDLPVLVTLAVALSYALSDSGEYGRAHAVLADLVQRGGEEVDDRSRGRINYALARLSAHTGRSAKGVAYAQRAVEAYRLVGDEYSLFNALQAQAAVLLDEGETEAAAESLAEARLLLGPKPGAVDLGFLLVEEARCHLQRGQHEESVDAARDAVELLGDLSVPGELGDAYLVLARAYEELGEDDRAERAYTSAIDALMRQNGWLRELAKAHRWYGKFLRAQGRPEAAMDAFERASDLSLRLHQRLDAVG